MSWLLLVGCLPAEDAERDGTFVGNPGLTAKVLNGPNEVSEGGVLVSQELLVTPCEPGSGDINLGAPAFEFAGEQSLYTQQIPAGHYCEVFVVVQQLELRFASADKGEITLSGGDLDLRIDSDLVAEDGGRYAIVLGDADWLAELALQAAPGDNLVSENADLEAVWLDGLLERSSVQEL